MVKGPKRVTKRRKPRAQRPSHSATQTRQVVMKAKVKLNNKRLAKCAAAVALRQLPGTCRKKRVLRKGPPLRPTTNHGYMLRSRSPLQEDNFSQMLVVSPVSPPISSPSPHAKPRLKSQSTSHDSGIESATNTSDSEDSNASASETSDFGASFSPSSSSSAAAAPTRLIATSSTTTTTRVQKVSTELLITAAEKVSLTDAPMEKSVAVTHVEYSFTSAADSFVVTYDHGDIPEILQDIEEVISADTKATKIVTPVEIFSSSSHEDISLESTSTSSEVHELSLCQEQLNDSLCSTGGKQLTYLYNASAGELEFVIEVFRGAQHVVPPCRIPAILPPKTRSCPKYTLILDLDETLVHCFTNEPPVKFDHSFTVEVPGPSGNGDMAELAVFARLRPFVKEFLEKVSKIFEVVVFTASMKNYSSKMLDLLDPQGRYIKYRFYRDHCVPVGCSFVKDLSIFTRDLSKLIIVDNQIASFAFQIDNGIPIRSWVGDDEDRELLSLASYLETIAANEDLDVREYIRHSLRIPNQLQNHMDIYYSHPFGGNVSSPDSSSSTE